mmetsp:Transcript_116919/g.268301  ORF Transcript_116919/g.268301 Transcript_116919/m.268301 type:complete len:222 (+) Transcript_116919:4196-4861(+)
MAWVHMHRLFAAFDWFPTTSGWYSSLATYRSSFFNAGAGMLSLSNFFSLSKNCVSVSTFLAASQSVFSPRSTQTASIVIITSGGGFTKALISVMSFLSNWSKALSDFSNAGIATSRSACASSFTSFTAAACALTTASSLATISCSLDAFPFSSVTTTINSSVSTFFCASTGCIAVIDSLRSATVALASFSFSRPTLRRRWAIVFSDFFSSYISRYNPMRSK